MKEIKIPSPRTYSFQDKEKARLASKKGAKTKKINKVKKLHQELIKEWEMTPEEIFEEIYG